MKKILDFVTSDNVLIVLADIIIVSLIFWKG